MPVSEQTPRPAGPPTALDELRRAGRAVRWYVASVMGDNYYERYLAHRERTHPGEPVMTKAEYWRARTDAQENNPSTRCC